MSPDQAPAPTRERRRSTWASATSPSATRPRTPRPTAASSSTAQHGDIVTAATATWSATTTHANTGDIDAGNHSPVIVGQRQRGGGQLADAGDDIISDNKGPVLNDVDTSGGNPAAARWRRPLGIGGGGNAATPAAAAAAVDHLDTTSTTDTPTTATSGSDNTAARQLRCNRRQPRRQLGRTTHNTDSSTPIATTTTRVTTPTPTSTPTSTPRRRRTCSDPTTDSPLAGTSFRSPPVARLRLKRSQKRTP